MQYRTYKLIASAGMLLAFTACVGRPAQAQTTTPESSPKWEYKVTPYLWLSSLKGDIGSEGRTVSVDAKFKDIFKKVKFAGMVTFEAHREKLSYLVDVVYTDLRDDVSGNIPTPIQPASVPGTIAVKSTALIVTPAVGWRVAQDEKGFADVLAGARIWFQTTELKLKVGGLPDQSLSSKPSWVDPIIGGRARTALSPKWSASVLGDIGGFGVGSKFTWQLFGAFHLDVGRGNAVVLGYRALDVDYKKSNTTYNTTQQGPILGFTFGL